MPENVATGGGEGSENQKVDNHKSRHAKARSKSRKQRKAAARLNLGPRACKWNPYGCITTVVGDNNHETTCKFAVDDLVESICRIQRDLESAANVSDGPWPVIRSCARSLKVLELNDALITDPVMSSPITFGSNSCWSSAGPPSFGDLQEYGLEPSTVVKNKTVKKPENASWSRVRRQINVGDHQADSVEFLLNLALKSPLTSFPFRIPEWVIRRMPDALGENSLNATPTFSQADIHCDRGMSTVCAQLGLCIKLWLLWPPTPHNNKIFYPAFEESLQSNTSCFKRIGGLLEKGQICIATENHAIFIPAGWMHYVYTQQGGFLIGNSFSGREDLHIFLSCIKEEMKVSTDAHDQETQIRFLVLTVQRSLSSPDQRVVEQAAEVWMSLVDAMDEGNLTRGLKWSKNLMKYMKIAIKDAGSVNTFNVEPNCPCGTQGQAGFFVHFSHHVPRNCL